MSVLSPADLNWFEIKFSANLISEDKANLPFILSSERVLRISAVLNSSMVFDSVQLVFISSKVPIIIIMNSLIFLMNLNTFVVIKND